MLIMWRHTGQSVTIDDHIELEVLESRHNKVKLGIRAPRSVTVSRKEEQVTRSENITAAWSIDSTTIEQLLTNLSRTSVNRLTDSLPAPDNQRDYPAYPEKD